MISSLLYKFYKNLMVDLLNRGTFIARWNYYILFVKTELNVPKIIYSAEAVTIGVL